MDPVTIAMVGQAATAASAATAATATTAAAAAIPAAASTAGLFGAGGAITAAQTLSTLSTAGSAVSMLQAGNADSSAADFQIEQEKIRATDESIGRRERLLDAIAMQNAGSSAGGITQVGTPQNIFDTDMKKFEYEDLSAKVSSGNQRSLLSARGDTSKRSSRLGAGISLLDFGSKVKAIG